MAIHPPSFVTETEALQRTIDLLSEINDLDRLIPRVLEIVAEVTGATSCAFFENSSEGRIWLRYWYSNGTSYLPGDLANLDSEKFGVVRGLAEGFEAPPEYLGIPTTRTGVVELDHVKGTCIPEFDQFAVGTGWELELNIGVGVGGERDMTLCIYRGRELPFTRLGASSHPLSPRLRRTGRSDAPRRIQRRISWVWRGESFIKIHLISIIYGVEGWPGVWSS